MRLNKILISACLLGENVRYNGDNSRISSAMIQQCHEAGRLVAVCPEMAGGLLTPRAPAEIEGGNADAVLSGKSSIRRKDGGDVTDAFMQGAELALAMCMQHHISIAILKEGSPSCGVNCVNDGSFSACKIKGQGLTARLLARHGILVFNEHQISSAVGKTC